MRPRTAFAASVPTRKRTGCARIYTVSTRLIVGGLSRLLLPHGADYSWRRCGISRGTLLRSHCGVDHYARRVQDSTWYLLHEDMRNELESVVKMSPLQVNQLAKITKAAARGIVYAHASGACEYDQQQFLNTIYDVRAKYAEADDHYVYILNSENQPSQLIASHDREGSQDLLNRLLGHICFYHMGGLTDIKARTRTDRRHFPRADLRRRRRRPDFPLQRRTCPGDRPVLNNR